MRPAALDCYQTSGNGALSAMGGWVSHRLASGPGLTLPSGEWLTTGGRPGRAGWKPNCSEESKLWRAWSPSIDPRPTEANLAFGSRGKSLGDRRFGEADFTSTCIHLHPYPEGNREIFGAMTGLDSGEDRDAEVVGLLGYEVGDCA